MKRLKLSVTLALLLAFGALSGCSFWPEKSVYLKPGQVAELAQEGRFKVWVTNKESGKRETRVIDTKKLTGPLWIGRPLEGFDNGE